MTMMMHFHAAFVHIFTASHHARAAPLHLFTRSFRNLLWIGATASEREEA